MAQATNSTEPTTGNSSNSNGHTSDHGLMVREYEMHSLAPYQGHAPTGSYVDSPQQGMSMSQIAHALRRRWLIALIAGLLMGAPVAVLVWLVTPDNYEVLALLRVGDPPGSRQNSGFYIRNETEYKQYKETQVARIRGTLVLQGALKKPGIYQLPMLSGEKEPETFLKDELVVVSPPQSELIQIKMFGRDPKQLVQIVNAVQDSYMENVVEAERLLMLAQQRSFEDAIRVKTNEIDQKRDAYVKLLQLVNDPQSGKTSVKMSQLTIQMSELYHQLEEIGSNIAKLDRQITLKEYNDQEGTGVPAMVLEKVFQQDEKLTQLEKQLDYYQYMRQSTIPTVRNPDRDQSIRSYNAQIQETQSKIDERRKTLEARINDTVGQDPSMTRPGDFPGTLKELKLQRQAMESQKQQAEQRLTKLSEATESFSSSSAQMKNLDSELKSLDEVRGGLEKDLEQLKLQLSYGTRVTVVEKATVPEGTNPIFRMVLTIFSGILAFVIGSGAVVGMEYQARRLNSTSELSSHTGLRVLGTVPNLEALSRSKGINGASALQGILAESVDGIRTMLLTRANSPRSVMVTSAGDREGKTTVASHLAASLARSGRRTLLVDGDLRSPTAHAMFNAALDPGLCELLRHEIELEAAIQPTQVDGLMIIAAGQCDYQAISALSKGVMKEILEHAREQFDFIIFDGAPVLNYADTLQMCANVDAAVLSVRRDVSQIHKVYEAKERLESIGVKVLGGVVNGISATSRRPAYALPAPT